MILDRVVICNGCQEKIKIPAKEASVGQTVAPSSPESSDDTTSETRKDPSPADVDPSLPPSGVFKLCWFRYANGERCEARAKFKLERTVHHSEGVSSYSVMFTCDEHLGPSCETGDIIEVIA